MMHIIEFYSYLSGMSAAIYFAVCLVCGLQLCFGIFSHRQASNRLLSRVLGGVFLVMSCSAVCYIISNLWNIESLTHIGVTIDIFAFSGIACVAYILYSNNEPSKRWLAGLVCPFVLLGIMNICMDRQTVLFVTAALVLLIQMVYFGIIFIRRERHLDDLYADPERHSLKWMWGFIGLFMGWWLVNIVFSSDILSPWRDMTAYVYMSVIMLFAFAQVSKQGAPVSPETQRAVEETNGPLPASPGRGGVSDPQPTNVDDRQSPNAKRLIELMETEQMYLNPDLTVEDVVKRLGTNTKYFSNILHHEMHTTFSQWVNEYRIEHAKQLLQNKDEKVVNLAWQCGFNSNQSFYRTFAKYTGSTPTEWREK